jgi:ribosomal protein S18 acetylase RimI-like enzyme
VTGEPLAQPFLLRPAAPGDDAFLRALYRSTREPEIAAWGWPEPQVAAFCEMQFRAQSAGYRQSYPEAEYLVISAANDGPIGRLTRAQRADSLALVDIALLPAFRGRGAGTWAIRRLQQEAAARAVPLVLHVDKASPAFALYRRLGFAVVSEDGMRYGMRWAAGSPVSPSDDHRI